MTDCDPTFPPLLTGHALPASADPFEAACEGARAGRLGAGDLVWSRGQSHARLALVLEPDVPRPIALQMLALTMVATGDCLGALLPPQVPVQYRWPNRLLLDAGDAGGFRIALAPSSEDAAPDWLVVGVEIAVGARDGEREPGERVDITSVHEEGGHDLSAPAIVQSLAAHLVTWLHHWQEDGFRPAHELFMGRLEGRKPAATFRQAGGAIHGTALGLDEAGSLIVKPEHGHAETLAIAEAFDLDTGAVR